MRTKLMEVVDQSASGFVATVDPLRYAGEWNGVDPDALEHKGLALSLVTPGSIVLDVGCGGGDWALMLRDLRECKVKGIEPSKIRAAVAQKRGVDVHIGILDQDFVLRCKPFDVVTFIEVLEHIHDPRQALQLAYKCLRPGGILIVTVPNVAHWTIRLKLLAGQFDYRESGLMDATHVRWFTRRTLRRLVEDVGFVVDFEDVARGTWLPAYYVRRPWRWFSLRMRQQFLDKLCKWWPCLFGSQHILSARR